MIVVVASGIAGAFAWSGRAAATAPCQTWSPVAMTGMRLEVVRQDGSPIPASDPVVGTIPAALCLEPGDARGSVVTAKDCYERELGGLFVMQGPQK